MSGFDTSWWDEGDNDFEYGWRLIIYVIRAENEPGGILIRTDFVKGDKDFAKSVVNHVLPEYNGRVISHRISGILPSG